MGLDCSGSCMKYLLFLFNFIFFVCGAAILGVSIWAYVDPSVTQYVSLTVDSSYNAALIVLIVVGAVIFLVGFLGCCGACKESSCLLSMFAALMVLILLLQITAGILAAVYQTEMNKTLKDELTKQTLRMTGSEDDPLTLSLNLLQTEFKCCGSTGPENYQNANITNPSGESMNVPQSCCVHRTPEGRTDKPTATDWTTCSTGWENEEQVYQDGCYDALLNWIHNHAAILLGIGFGLAAVEILGIVLACCVKSKISQSY